MNESNLHQVSEHLNPGLSGAEPRFELGAEALSFESAAEALSPEALAPETLSPETLRDLPSSTHDIPMAVREASSPVPPVKKQSSPLFWGVGSAGAIALLGIGLFFGLRPQSATSTANVAAQPAPSGVPSATSQLPTNPGNSGESVASLASPLLNHLPYEEAPKGELAPITPNGEILMRKAASAKFVEMQEAARAAGIELVPISGFRSVEDQNHVFFDVKAQRGQDTTTRSEVSAPPGYSEHHTGYAVDIGDGDRPELNLLTDFEKGQAYQWLKENAGFYSFELSFPKNNTQGVSYEPWHWRFVGDRNSLETFYRARTSVPAKAK